MDCPLGLSLCEADVGPADTRCVMFPGWWENALAGRNCGPDAVVLFAIGRPLPMRAPAAPHDIATRDDGKVRAPVAPVKAAGQRLQRVGVMAAQLTSRPPRCVRG